MRTLSLSLAVSASFLAFALTGCSGAPDADVDGAETADSEDALSSTANFGYVTVRRDFRKCAWPMCGGYWVKKVNEQKTRCVDNTLQDECYVESIQLTGLNLSQREQDEVSGAMAQGNTVLRVRAYKKRINGANYGLLKANEAWVGATGSTPDGSFYRIADNGTRCITTPCPSTSATTLNSNDSHNLLRVSLDQTETAATPELLDRAESAIGTEEGVIIAGGVALPKCMAQAKNCGPFATATEFYLKVTRREGKSCGSRALSWCNANQFCQWAEGDICGAADAAGKCAYRPEMCIALYKPVCGCDGKTYGNSCQAAAAGASVSTAGACAAPTP